MLDIYENVTYNLDINTRIYILIFSYSQLYIIIKIIIIITFISLL